MQPLKKNAKDSLNEPVLKQIWSNMDVSKDPHFMQCTSVFSNRDGSRKKYPSKLQALQAFHYAVEGKQRSSIDFKRGLRIGVEDSLQNLHAQMSVGNLLPIYKKQLIRKMTNGYLHLLRIWKKPTRP